MSNMVTSNGQTQEKDTQRVSFSEQVTCYDSIPKPTNGDPALPRKRLDSHLWQIARKRLDSIVLHGNPLREEVMENNLSPLHFTVKSCATVFLIYLLIGIAAYSYLVERWSIIDSLYFTVVTLTTVGYGDLTPSTPLAKLFTCIFTLTGVTFIGIALGVLAAYVLDVQQYTFLEHRKDSDKRFIHHLDVESRGDISSFFEESTPAEENDVEEKPHGFWPKFLNLILHRYLPIQAVLYIIVYFIYGREEWGWLNMLYYLIISSTTVGYGDFAPISPGGRAFGIIFVLLTIGTMGDMLVRSADLVLEERWLNYLHFLKRRELKLFHIKEMDAQGDDKVSMLEYVEFILTKLELVDEKMLKDLHEQFKGLDVTDSGFISKEDLKQQMKRSVLKARKKLALSAYKKNLMELSGELSGELSEDSFGRF